MSFYTRNCFMIALNQEKWLCIQNKICNILCFGNESPSRTVVFQKQI